MLHKLYNPQKAESSFLHDLKHLSEKKSGIDFNMTKKSVLKCSLQQTII